MPTFTPVFGLYLPNVNSPDDEDLWGDQLNANFSMLETIVDTLCPVGHSVVYRGGTVPAPYFALEDGSAVSRTGFPRLYTAIGTTYGAGDGSTTFNLPDSRNRVDVGIDSGTPSGRLTTAISGINGTVLGAAGGDQRVQNHNHTLTDPQHAHGSVMTPAGGQNVGSAAAPAVNITSTTAPASTGITIAAYGAGASQNVQPTLVATKMIRVQ